jgi:tetratricopeptide (TPR) repeat protein
MMRFVFWLGLLLGSGAVAWAQEETDAQRELRTMVELQRALLARAVAADSTAALDDVRPRLQYLVFRYEEFVRKHPREVAGYVSYAMLLGSEVLGERRRAAALLLKANEIDGDQPLIKNQLGNYLAEDGKPQEALNYYLAAVRLAPEEALYHYQTGLLLTLAEEEFVASGEWTRETVTKTAREALGRAQELAPDSFEYGYRHAQSFYTAEPKDWEGALTAWRNLEARAGTALGRQTARLHQANVLLETGDRTAARILLDGVNLPELREQRAELEARAEGADDAG